MRVKDEEKEVVKKDILDFLKKERIYHNLSEIARAVDKAPPTVLKYVNELEKEGNVIVLDKKSMKLIKIKESGKHGS